MTEEKILKTRLKNKKRFILVQLQNIETILADIHEVVELGEK